MLLHVDSTYKITVNEFVVVCLGLSDRGGKFHLLGVAISSHQNEDAYVKLFGTIKSLCVEHLGKDFHPTYVMADGDLAISNACFREFGKRPLMCYFHLMYNVRKNFCKKRFRRMCWILF